MVAGTLYTYANSFRGAQVRIAAAYSGASLKVVEVNPSDKSHPCHVPSFESDDKKFHLLESTAIAYYLADDALRGGASLEDRARVFQWLQYGSTSAQSAVASWVYPALSLTESNKQLVERAKHDLKQVFQCLNEHLKTRTYLVGERITLADIGLATELQLAFEHVLDEAFRSQFVNVTRWFTTVVNQAKVRAILGEVKLCVTPAEYNAAKHAEHKAAATAKPAEKAKPAAAEKPKPAPKAAAPANDEEEEEDPALAEPKQTDPFATMPKGNFNMDEFKRTYSNKDTKTVALPYFWQNFEKEFYSLWYCEYKYADELALVFMSSNLIGGMFQRIEKLRKNAFASMAVLGENNKNTIAGVWMWKGQELAFPLCPDWTTDYESFEWRKLNPDNETDKKLVDDFFLQEVEVRGLKFNCGKIFK